MQSRKTQGEKQMAGNKNKPEGSPALTHHRPKKPRFSGRESENILLYPGGIGNTAKNFKIKTIRISILLNM
jgi:hypothetical protein